MTSEKGASDRAPKEDADDTDADTTRYCGMIYPYFRGGGRSGRPRVYASTRSRHASSWFTQGRSCPLIRGGTERVRSSLVATLRASRMNHCEIGEPHEIQ